MIKQFKASEVECNGVGGKGYQVVRKHKNQIIAICQEVRDLLGADELYSLATKDKNTDYHRGRRFEDVEDNAFRLITGIAEHVSSYMEDETLIEMHVASILKMLSTEDKVTLVVDACRDCASADHWYTFEKDWG